MLCGSGQAGEASDPEGEKEGLTLMPSAPGSGAIGGLNKKTPGGMYQTPWGSSREESTLGWLLFPPPASWAVDRKRLFLWLFMSAILDPTGNPSRNPSSPVKMLACQVVIN